MTGKKCPQLWLACLGLLSVAANCEQCSTPTNPRRGNLDRAADAVLINGDDGRTYAVLANPELEHLRFFDLTVEAFVFAPNAYLPLSVPVGPDTRRVAVADGDNTNIYALDGATDRVFVVRAFPERSPSGVPGEPAFALAGEPLVTGRAPGDLAAYRADDTPAGDDDDDDDQHDGDVELWITLPDESAVQVLGLDGVELARVSLDALDGEAARPDDIVADPLGDSVVVADATLPFVHIFSRATKQLERSLDVGGPVGSLSVGVIDIGDGLAPVVLAIRRDAPIVVAIKLFRAVPEERYAVLGSAEVPGIPLVGYVPDHRESATVCCRELSAEAVAAGQATDAWGAVATADGKVTYLQIAGTDGLVRIFDNVLEDAELGTALTDDWVPAPGDENREPVPALAVGGDFGDPPFVPLLALNEQLSLVWEGSPPGLAGVLGTWDGAAFSASSADLEARGALVGDLAFLTPQDPGAGCPDSIAGVVQSVDAATIVVALDDDSQEPCLAAATLRASVAAADAFVVLDRRGDVLGRLTLTDPTAPPVPGSSLSIGGAVLTVTASDAGPPTQRGSTLLVPINPQTAIIDLDLSDAPSPNSSDGGGRGQGALLPVALVGGQMTVPGVELGTQISARRMVIATGSADRFGLNTLFVCDEGETIPGLCEEFR